MYMTYDIQVSKYKFIDAIFDGHIKTVQYGTEVMKLVVIFDFFVVIVLLLTIICPHRYFLSRFRCSPQSLFAAIHLFHGVMIHYEDICWQCNIEFE